MASGPQRLCKNISLCRVWWLLPRIHSQIQGEKDFAQLEAGNVLPVLMQGFFLIYTTRNTPHFHKVSWHDLKAPPSSHLAWQNHLLPAMNEASVILLFHREEDGLGIRTAPALQEACGRCGLSWALLAHWARKPGPPVSKVGGSHVWLGHTSLTAMLWAVRMPRTGNTAPYRQHNCQGQRLIGEYLSLVYLHWWLQAVNLAHFSQ